MSKPDSVVAAVIESFKKRSEIGLAKYGTNLDRTDLTTLDWIQHAQEEFMDGILYLEKLKQIFRVAKPTGTETKTTIESDSATKDKAEAEAEADAKVKKENNTLEEFDYIKHLCSY